MNTDYLLPLLGVLFCGSVVLAQKPDAPAAPATPAPATPAPATPAPATPAPATPAPDPAAELEALVHTNAAGQTLPYRFGAPAERPEGAKVPLLVLLHGVGERGDDNRKQLVHGAKDILAYRTRSGKPFYFLAPQCPANDLWVDTTWNLPAHTMKEAPTAALRMAMDLIAKTVRENPGIDPDRVYLAGISMGGFGCWEILQRDPSPYAGALIACGGPDTNFASRLKDVPIWATHGEVDTVVLPGRPLAMQKEIEKAGGRRMIVSIYPKIHHAVWVQTFSIQAHLDWLFAQNRKDRGH